MKKIILGKDKIAFERIGQIGKPKLLMLHGFGANHRYFLPSVEYLKKDYDILIPDLPGFGLSDTLKKENVSFEDYVEVITDLYEFLEFKPFNLISHSFGGVLSIILAQKYKKDIEKLIFFGTPWSSSCVKKNFWIKMSEQIPYSISRSEQILKIINKLRKKLSPALLSKSLKVINPHFYEINSKTGFVENTFKTMDLKLLNELKRLILNFDLKLTAQDIVSPSLVVFGDHDNIVSTLEGSLLSRLIPGGRLRILKGKFATHMLNLDFPEKTAVIIDNFLKKS